MAKPHRTLLSLVFATMATVSPLAGQQSPSRSPVVAGLFSAWIPGVGSYYAGDASHGTRHLVIAGVTAAGVLIPDCQILSSEDTDTACAIGLISAVGYVANWIWAIVVGVNDAEEFNRSHRVARLRVAPELVVVGRREPRVGLALVSLRF
ncbi:MAG: hypothetical protein PVF05_11710 [Gemmatimonadales bacterium]|jgi:hypothetical protein